MDIKEETLKKVRKQFYIKDCWTKNELIEKTCLSAGTITNCLKRLLIDHQILYEEDAESTGGRKI